MVSPSSAGAALAPLPETTGILASALVGLPPRRLGAAAGARDQAGRHALLVLEQRLEDMRRA